LAQFGQTQLVFPRNFRLLDSPAVWIIGSLSHQSIYCVGRRIFSKCPLCDRPPTNFSHLPFLPPCHRQISLFSKRHLGQQGTPSSISDNPLPATPPLVGRGAHRHAIGMFVVTEADAAAIRAVFNQEGELSAAIELRRRFPGVTDNAKARACAWTIAGWMPRPEQPHPVTRLRPRKDS
jgi:hypothetical protein